MLQMQIKCALTYSKICGKRLSEKALRPFRFLFFSAMKATAGSSAATSLLPAFSFFTPNGKFGNKKSNRYKN